MDIMDMYVRLVCVGLGITMSFFLSRRMLDEYRIRRFYINLNRNMVNGEICVSYIKCYFVEERINPHNKPWT
jgi:hypothetical protein